ncbi:MAG: helix-turn-helix domain-containing protein [Christensenellales bacterium]
MCDAAAEAGVSQETLRRWIVQYEADGAAARVSA